MSRFISATEQRTRRLDIDSTGTLALCASGMRTIVPQTMPRLDLLSVGPDETLFSSNPANIGVIILYIVGGRWKAVLVRGSHGFPKAQRISSVSELASTEGNVRSAMCLRRWATCRSLQPAHGGS